MDIAYSNGMVTVAGAVALGIIKLERLRWIVSTFSALKSSRADVLVDCKRTHIGNLLPGLSLAVLPFETLNILFRPAPLAAGMVSFLNLREERLCVNNAISATKNTWKGSTKDCGQMVYWC